MKTKLYPFIFKTQFKDKIWGGQKIKTILNKDYGDLPNCGETWEISGVSGNISIVANGELTGESLTNLISEHKENLLGKHVWEAYGNEFPLLIKFIDANDDLSIQVHPDDKLAKERHNSVGKTEMWYILGADSDAQLNVGFNQPINQSVYLDKLNTNQLDSILNFEKVKKGDVYFLPAGRVHYIGKGILLAEIQQTSDITYRIYDFDRRDDKGNLRELHTDLALDAIDYTYHKNYKTDYLDTIDSKSTTLVNCKYFTTNKLNISNEQLVTNNYDSFIIYIVVNGNMNVVTGSTIQEVKMGEVILIPASIEHFTIVPINSVELLEVYIP